MKRTINDILNLPYADLSAEEREQIKALKNNEVSGSVYDRIRNILGQNNHAEQKDIRDLLEAEAAGAEMTAAEYWRVFDFKRSIYPTLLNIVEGATKKEKDEKISKMTMEEKVDMVISNGDTATQARRYE